MEFTTPNFPSSLPDVYHETINFVAPLGYQLQATILHLKLHNSTNCTSQGIELVDDLIPDDLQSPGTVENVPYCSGNELSPFLSFLNRLRAEFFSNHQNLSQNLFGGARIRIKAIEGERI